MHVDKLKLMDIIEENVIEPVVEFYNDSRRLVQKCKKPDAKGILTFVVIDYQNFPKLLLRQQLDF